MRTNVWLIAGGVLSALAGLLHLAIIVGGPAWYRFFHAGERLARAAERGSPQPALVTAAIASVLFVWSAYAFAGAGLVRPLPLTRTALVLISAAYLFRALWLPAALVTGRADAFLWWSSVIVLGYGVVYALGTWQAWPALTRRA